MLTIVILTVAVLQTFHVQLLIHVGECVSDNLDQDSVGNCAWNINCGWEPLHIPGGIFVNGQCKDSGWNHDAQLVLQDAEILRKNDTTMLSVFNALETQFSHCKKFIISQIHTYDYAKNEQICGQLQCPQDWTRTFFDWITHGTYLKRCICERQFDLTLNYVISQCFQVMIDSRDDQESENRKHAYEYKQHWDKLLNFLADLTSLRLDHGESQPYVYAVMIQKLTQATR